MDYKNVKAETPEEYEASASQERSALEQAPPAPPADAAVSPEIDVNADIEKAKDGIDINAAFGKSAPVDVVEESPVPPSPAKDNSLDLSSAFGSSPASTYKEFGPPSDLMNAPADSLEEFDLPMDRVLKSAGLLRGKYPELQFIGPDRPMTAAEAQDVRGRGPAHVVGRMGLSGLVAEADDEIGGLISMAKGGNYAAEMKKLNREKMLIEKENPWLAPGAKVGGFIAGAIGLRLFGAWAIAKYGAQYAPKVIAAYEAASPAMKLAVSSSVAGTAAAYTGAMSSPGAISEGEGVDVAMSAATAAPFGVLAPPVGAGLSYTARKLAVPVSSVFTKLKNELKQYAKNPKVIDDINVEKSVKEIQQGVFETFGEIDTAITNKSAEWKDAALAVQEAAETLTKNREEVKRALGSAEVPEETAQRVVDGLERLKDIATQESRATVDDTLKGNTIKASRVFGSAFQETIQELKGVKGFVGTDKPVADEIGGYLQRMIQSHMRRVIGPSAPGMFSDAANRANLKKVYDGNYDLGAEEIKDIIQDIRKRGEISWDTPAAEMTQRNAWKTLSKRLDANLKKAFPKYADRMEDVASKFALLESVSDVIRGSKSTAVKKVDGSVVMTGSDSTLVKNLRKISADLTENDEAILRDFSNRVGIDVVSAIKRVNLAKKAIKDGNFDDLATKIANAKQASNDILLLQSAAPQELRSHADAIAAAANYEAIMNKAADDVLQLADKYRDVTVKTTITSGKMRMAGVKPAWDYAQQPGKPWSLPSKIEKLTGKGSAGGMSDKYIPDRNVIEALEQFDSTPGSLNGILQKLDNIAIRREFEKPTRFGSTAANTGEAIGGFLGSAFGGVGSKAGRAIGAQIGSFGQKYGHKVSRNLVKLMLTIAGENGKMRTMPTAAAIASSNVEALKEWRMKKGTDLYNGFVQDIRTDDSLSASEKIRAIRELTNIRLIEDFNDQETEQPKAQGPAIESLLENMGG